MLSVANQQINSMPFIRSLTDMYDRIERGEEILCDCLPGTGHACSLLRRRANKNLLRAGDGVRSASTNSAVAISAFEKQPLNRTSSSSVCADLSAKPCFDLRVATDYIILAASLTLLIVLSILGWRIVFHHL